MPTPLSWPLTPSAPSTAPEASSPSGGARGAQPDFGVDVSTYPDLDGTFSSLTGIGAVTQAVARSLEDSRRGIDLRKWLNDDLDAARIWHLQEAIRGQALKDERVSDAEVVITLSARHELRIIVRIRTVAFGPLRLVLKVTALSVEVLAD